MKKIALNFVPLQEQIFDINVFTKERDNHDFKNEDSEIFALTIGDEKEQFWFSFFPKNDFTPVVYKSNENIYLTLRYIFKTLCDRCIKTLVEKNEYTIETHFASQKVRFIIKSYDEGNQIVWLSPYFLETTQKFGFLLDFKFAVNQGQSFSRKIQQLSLSLNGEYKSNNNLYYDKFNMLKSFARFYYKKTFANSIIDFAGFTQLDSFQLQNKTYIFGNNEEANYPSTGLKKSGPYKKVNQSALFYFLRNEDEKDKALKLYTALRGENLDDNKFYGGLEETYKLTINQNNIKGLNSDKYKFVDEIEQVAIEIKNKHPDEKIIIFAFSPRKEEGGAGQKRYLTIKYGFAQQNIPVQFVQYSTVTSPYALKSSIPNIALAVFSKLGGEPWKVKSSGEDCLVLGISQTIYRKAGSKAKKFIAYSVLLDTGGIYKSLEVLSNEENIESYFAKLKISLKKVLTEETKKYKKVVLHVTFKLKIKELNIIKETLSGFDSEIDFVVIRINTENDFWGYEQTQHHLTPSRNTCISIADTKYLIWLEGTKSNFDSPEKRYSGPMYVDFFYTSKPLNENDKRTYLQDLLNLSGANWRGLNAKAVPVSVYYCKLVSEYIKDFKEVLNIEELKNEFSNPWFL